MGLSEQDGNKSRILRVDLEREQITEEYLGEDIVRTYLGGTALGTKILYEEVPPGVEWNSPENRLILAGGPMNSSRVAGSGCFSVVTKGPLTNGAASSQANGYFGAYLKFAGFSTIIFQGCAKRWLYLHIHDGIAELRDASRLLGKDTWETEDLIKAELGKTEREMSVFGIGPAGENLVKFAAIVGDKGHVAGHNGVGAVMGSKRLKAVAVARGKTAVLAKDKARLTALSKKMVEDFRSTPGNKEQFNWGTSFLYSMLHQRGMLPVKNLNTSIFPEHADFVGENYRSRFELTPDPCWACPSHHCHIMKITEGPNAGYVGEEPEYEGLAAWGSLIGQTDVEAAFILCNLTDRLGFEINESSWLIAFLMECFEKGLISQKETDGIQMTWGNVGAVMTMLDKIAHRQGCGDIFAEGLVRTAQRLGGEAADIGVYAKKGVAPRGHDHRAKWSEMFDTATSNTGTLETGNVLLPDDPFAPHDIVEALVKHKGMRIFVDSLVMCQQATMTYISMQFDHLVDMLNAVTGWDMTLEEARQVGLRAVNLLRAFNIRHGITPEVEEPSARWSSVPVDGPVKGKGIMPHWEKMLDEYYELMGWDRASGKPLPDTLKTLGLETVIADIW